MVLESTGAGATELEPARRDAPEHESVLPPEHPLHHPRHGRRQRLALACAVVFFLTPAAAFGLGARPGEIENRPLAPFPTEATGLAAWATDHLPLRAAGVRAAEAVSRGVFGEPPPFVQARQPPEVGSAVSPGTEQHDQLLGASGYPDIVEGTDGWLYYGNDVAAKCQPARSVDAVMAGLARLRRAVEASGRTFVLVVAPDKSTAVPEHLPATYPGKDCATAATAQFWSRVTSGGGAVDLRGDLATLAAVTGAPVYYPLDTHWTDLGALIMLRGVAERLHPGISATWTVGPPATASVPADLPTLLGRTGSKDEQYYPLSADGGPSHTGPLVNDLSRAARFVGPTGVGVVPERVGLLGDSFSLAATRYLPAVFTDVTAVSYADAAVDPVTLADVLVPARVVVVEVVERSLAAGDPAFLDPAVIDRIGAGLAAHPVR